MMKIGTLVDRPTWPEWRLFLAYSELDPEALDNSVWELNPGNNYKIELAQYILTVELSDRA